jgi:hypothetical protein
MAYPPQILPAASRLLDPALLIAFFPNLCACRACLTNTRGSDSGRYCEAQERRSIKCGRLPALFADF